jgi:hypothetical protein
MIFYVIFIELSFILTYIVCLLRSMSTGYD